MYAPPVSALRSHLQRHWGVCFGRLGLFVGVVVVVPRHGYHRGGFDRPALISERAMIVRVERDLYVALAGFETGQVVVRSIRPSNLHAVHVYVRVAFARDVVIVDVLRRPGPTARQEEKIHPAFVFRNRADFQTDMFLGLYRLVVFLAPCRLVMFLAPEAATFVTRMLTAFISPS